MNKELKIKKLLDEGFSIRKVAELVRVSNDTVQKVKSRGRYYLDLESGEVVFTSKKISEEEQIFHVLSQDSLLHNIYFSKTKMIEDRAVVPRITNFMIGYLDSLKLENKESLERKHRGYYKKKVKLIRCDENGVRDIFFLPIIQDFIQREQAFIGNNYFLDENGMPRGWGLWSLYIGEDWERHLREYIREAKRNCLKTDREIRQYMMEKIKGEADSEKKESRIKYNFINSFVTSKLIERYGYDFKFDEYNRIVYMDLSAYYNNLLPSEYMEIVKNYLDK